MSKRAAKGRKIRLQWQDQKGRLVLVEGTVVRLRATTVTASNRPSYSDTVNYEHRYSLDTGKPVMKDTKDRYCHFEIVLDDLEQLRALARGVTVKES